MTVAPDLPQTLAHAARELDLFSKVANAVRTLETEGHAAHVLVSPSGEIVVVGNDHSHVALRLVA